MIETSLLFLPFYIAVAAAGEYCSYSFHTSEYCSGGCCTDGCCFEWGYLGGGIAGLVGFLALILGCCCFCTRRRRAEQGVIVYGQGPTTTVAVNQALDQYPVQQGTSHAPVRAPGAGYSQPVPARFEPIPAPLNMPQASGYQQAPVGAAPAQKPEAQATSVPPPNKP